MVRLKPGQTIETELDGQWIQAVVDKVDASLVFIRFSSTHREWIYRGSTRFEPLFNDLSTNSNKVARSQSQRLEVEYGTVDALLTDKSSASKCRNARKSATGNRSQSTANENHSIVTKPVAARRGSAPRRSTSGRSDMVEMENAGSIGPYLDHLFTNVIAKDYVPHKCRPDCLVFTRPPSTIPVSEDPFSYKSLNPLEMPFHAGWLRYLLTGEPNDFGCQFIVYNAPCGRQLRSMHEVQRFLDRSNSKMTTDLFSFDPTLCINQEFRAEKTLTNIADMSYGKENVAVPCVNSVDNEVPGYIDYIPQRQPMGSVPRLDDDGFVVCCDCTDNCRDRSKCACQQLTAEASALTNPAGMVDSQAGYRYRRLGQFTVGGIYECNPQCRCDRRCSNRVVQQGLWARLQVFKTSRKGWGMRALHAIPKGTFLCTYVGAVYDENMAVQEGFDNGDEYQADLDYIETVEKPKEGYESAPEDPEHGKQAEAIRKYHEAISSSCTVDHEAQKTVRSAAESSLSDSPTSGIEDDRASRCSDFSSTSSVRNVFMSLEPIQPKKACDNGKSKPQASSPASTLTKSATAPSLTAYTTKVPSATVDSPEVPRAPTKESDKKDQPNASPITVPVVQMVDIIGSFDHQKSLCETDKELPNEVEQVSATKALRPSSDTESRGQPTSTEVQIKSIERAVTEKSADIQSLDPVLIEEPVSKETSVETVLQQQADSAKTKLQGQPNDSESQEQTIISEVSVATDESSNLSHENVVTSKTGGITVSSVECMPNSKVSMAMEEHVRIDPIALSDTPPIETKSTSESPQPAAHHNNLPSQMGNKTDPITITIESGEDTPSPPKSTDTVTIDNLNEDKSSPVEADVYEKEKKTPETIQHDTKLEECKTEDTTASDSTSVSVPFEKSRKVERERWRSTVFRNRSVSLLPEYASLRSVRAIARHVDFSLIPRVELTRLKVPESLVSSVKSQSAKHLKLNRRLHTIHREREQRKRREFEKRKKVRVQLIAEIQDLEVNTESKPSVDAEKPTTSDAQSSGMIPPLKLRLTRSATRSSSVYKIESNQSPSGSIDSKVSESSEQSQKPVEVMAKMELRRRHSLDKIGDLRPFKASHKSTDVPPQETRRHDRHHRHSQQQQRRFFPVAQPHWLPARIYFNDENPYIMDAKKMGNLGRYFNHSCNPNVFVQNVFINSHDPRLPEVAFFTKRNIAVGEEMTWDYGYTVDAVPFKVLYCYCGEPNCRIRLL